MKTESVKPKKVATTIHLTKEAQDTMLDHGYASARTMGEFISQLIMDYHARRTRQLTQAEIAQELHRLASLLEAAGEVAPVADKPMPVANVIDAPSNMVGVTVISEEAGREPS